jgi:hypothetical protein
MINILGSSPGEVLRTGWPQAVNVMHARSGGAATLNRMIAAAGAKPPAMRAEVRSAKAQGKLGARSKAQAESRACMREHGKKQGGKAYCRGLLHGVVEIDGSLGYSVEVL